MSRDKGDNSPKMSMNRKYQWPKKNKMNRKMLKNI